MKGNRKIEFTSHALMRAAQRRFLYKEMIRRFRKSYFYKPGRATARIYKYKELNFVTIVEKDRYLILTMYLE